MKAKAYRFSPYLLEIEAKRLLRDNQTVPMTRKRFEILLLLIERAGQVVRKEEIMQQVWPGQEVEESNLTQHIFFLRRTLGDDPRTPSFIITIPGAGYLFYQPVQLINEDGSEVTIGGLHPNKLTAVEETLPAQAGAERPTGHFRSSRKMMAIVVTSLMLILAAAALRFWRSSEKASQPSPPIVQPMVTRPGTKGDLRFSRDGRYIGFTSEGNTVDSLNLFVQSMDGGELKRLTTNSLTDHSLTWSPDNSKIAFLREGALSNRKNKIYIIPANGGGERLIGEAWHGLDWSPDGESLAICDSEGPGRPTGIYLLSLRTRRIDPVSRPNPSENIFDSNPRYSPNGRLIAFTRWTSTSNSDLYTIDLISGELHQLTTDRTQIVSHQWSPNGNEILFASNRNGNFRIWKIPATGGEPLSIEGPLGEVRHFDVQKSPQNKNLLAYTQLFTDTNIQVENIPGKGETPATRTPCSISSTRADHSPQFSPDNKKILFVSARSGFNEIWIADADCQNPTQVTSFRETGIGSPRWSPDGRSFLFDRLIDGQTDVLLFNIESGQYQNVTADKSPDFLPTWTADGDGFFFCSERLSAREIWKTGIHGGEPTKITRNGGFESWATKDGTGLYYTSYNSLFRLDLNNLREERVDELKEIFFGRYWTVMGDGIYYLTREVANRCRIYRFDIKTRSTSLLLELAGAPVKYVPGLSISSDEKQIVISLINYNPGDISLVTDWR